jgi:hypothetical protein
MHPNISYGVPAPADIPSHAVIAQKWGKWNSKLLSSSTVYSVTLSQSIYQHLHYFLKGNWYSNYRVCLSLSKHANI